MYLYLLRHAHADDPRKYKSDFDRALDGKGIKQLDELKTLFETKYSNVPMQTMVSTAMRTKLTYEAIQPILKVSSELFTSDLYLPSRDSLLRLLWETKESEQHVLVVSHNYGISEAASYYLGYHVEMKTAGVVVIHLEGIDQLNETSQGLGQLVDSYRI